MTIKLTANQRKGLVAARDQGNAWVAWGHKWSSPVNRTLNVLVAADLLTADHTKLTDAGLALIADTPAADDLSKATTAQSYEATTVEETPRGQAEAMQGNMIVNAKAASRFGGRSGVYRVGDDTFYGKRTKGPQMVSLFTNDRLVDCDTQLKQLEGALIRHASELNNDSSPMPHMRCRWEDMPGVIAQYQNNMRGSAPESGPSISYTIHGRKFSVSRGTVGDGPSFIYLYLVGGVTTNVVAQAEAMRESIYHAREYVRLLEETSPQAIRLDTLKPLSAIFGPPTAWAYTHKDNHLVMLKRQVNDSMGFDPAYKEEALYPASVPLQLQAVLDRLVNFVDDIMPQMGKLSFDLGELNETMIQAREVL